MCIDALILTSIEQTTEFHMTTLKTIYLTILHCVVAAAIFLYTNENYTLVKIDHSEQASNERCCGNGDELTALLDKHSRKK